jgi:hypothetical protein
MRQVTGSSEMVRSTLETVALKPLCAGFLLFENLFA